MGTGVVSGVCRDKNRPFPAGVRVDVARGQPFAAHAAHQCVVAVLRQDLGEVAACGRHMLAGDSGGVFWLNPLSQEGGVDRGRVCVCRTTVRDVAACVVLSYLHAH